MSARGFEFGRRGLQVLAALRLAAVKATRKCAEDAAQPRADRPARLLCWPGQDGRGPGRSRRTAAAGARDPVAPPPTASLGGASGRAAHGGDSDEWRAGMPHARRGVQRVLGCRMHDGGVCLARG